MATVTLRTLEETDAEIQELVLAAMVDGRIASGEADWILGSTGPDLKLGRLAMYPAAIEEAVRTQLRAQLAAYTSAEEAIKMAVFQLVPPWAFMLVKPAVPPANFYMPPPILAQALRFWETRVDLITIYSQIEATAETDVTLLALKAKEREALKVCRAQCVELGVLILDESVIVRQQKLLAQQPSLGHTSTEKQGHNLDEAIQPEIHNLLQLFFRDQFITIFRMLRREARFGDATPVFPHRREFPPLRWARDGRLMSETQLIMQEIDLRIQTGLAAILADTQHTQKYWARKDKAARRRMVDTVVEQAIWAAVHIENIAADRRALTNGYGTLSVIAPKRT